MNITSILEFLILLPEADDPERVLSQFESLTSIYGFAFYSVLVQPQPHRKLPRIVLAARWPRGWADIYVQRKYSLVDPTLRWLRSAQRPFRWKEVLPTLKTDPNRQRLKRMMQEASRHGLDDGYIFPIHGRNGLLGSLSIGGQMVDLSPSEITVFEAAAKAMFWRLLELRGQTGLLEAMDSPDIQLTRREMEVILLLANGLTSNEIARELAISSHTVDWYINGLHEKLGAKNRQHLIALAFRMGLIA